MHEIYSDELAVCNFLYNWEDSYNCTEWTVVLDGNIDYEGLHDEVEEYNRYSMNLHNTESSDTYGVSKLH